MSGYIDEVVAAHELGHAMVGQKHGHEVDRVKVWSAGIVFDHGLIGACWLTRDKEVPFIDDRPDPDYIRSLLAVAPAGQVAAEMWYERFRPGEKCPDGTSGDRAIFKKRLAWIPSEYSDLACTWKEASQHARELLEPIWPELVRRIPLLLEKKTLRQKHVRL